MKDQPDSSSDEEKRFRERLEKEIEDARYAKWKKEVMGHEVTPTKSPANKNVRVGSWTSIIGALITLILGNSLLSFIGLIICFIGLVYLYMGLYQERKRRRNLGI